MSACIEAGELTKARAYLAEVDAVDKPAKLLFFEGEWELAGKALTAEIELLRTTGNLEGELGVTLVLARLQRFAGRARTGRPSSAKGARDFRGRRSHT